MQVQVTQPESPIDTTCFPSPQRNLLSSWDSGNISMLTTISPEQKKEPGLFTMPKTAGNALKPCYGLHAKHLEPYEYSSSPSDREFPLYSVFEDRALLDAIVTSLEIEPLFPMDSLTILSAKLTTAPIEGLKTTIRRPGTFLNKDGRWIKGKPCRIDNCDKRAQSNGLCKGHGGGARCSHDGCNKSSQGGGLCRAHGGGKRCLHHGCHKGTQRNGYCYLHGGVRSCSVSGCSKKDRGSGKCFSHGGGRRCQAPRCCINVRRGTHCEKHLVRNV
uniref:Uncharacterized protein AlNc14C28G2668 n=1 Tax=Albugo laibachii Nc14 TaxID=890382 RepID=F0W739_9STRA|nr:conserved hypothetical protein [Albugo laibachii Nc14]|eukprot:CCA16938.1 conserved hypothetical protein [Albugo laibachii Nc14]